MTNARQDQEVATALWYVAHRRIDLIDDHLSCTLETDARVRTLFSAVSRGSERLIFNGDVPHSEWQQMRAPFQRGDFPFPVKYGYCTVGLVEQGPAGLKGHAAFCLHPHQTTFCVPAEALVRVPEGVPAKRATLAANMETALNAVWDAAAQPGDRIMVIGGGIVGLLIGYVSARIPGTEVYLTDILDSRRMVAEVLGLRFIDNEAFENHGEDFDVVFHTSASEGGLRSALACAGDEARIVEVSWFGDKAVSVPLGGAFHSKRLTLVSSQVGRVPPSRRSRWSPRRRLEKAMSLLNDPALDALVPNEIPFRQAPQLLPQVFDDSSGELPPVLRYEPP